MYSQKPVFSLNKVGKTWIRYENTLGCSKIKGLLEDKILQIHIPSAKVQSYSLHSDIGRSVFLQYVSNIKDTTEPSISMGRAVPRAQVHNKAIFDRSNANLRTRLSGLFPFSSERTYSNVVRYRLAQINFGAFETQKSHSEDIYLQGTTRGFHTLSNRLKENVGKTFITSFNESTKATVDKAVALSRKDKLKRAVKEYGSTVIVFHVGISLISLGTCYILVSSGLDVGKVLAPLGVSGSVAANAGTFVTAYAIHKVFAPVRISITLAATPFIVKYLRHIGFLKSPKPKVN